MSRLMFVRYLVLIVAVMDYPEIFLGFAELLHINAEMVPSDRSLLLPLTSYILTVQDRIYLVHSTP